MPIDPFGNYTATAYPSWVYLPGEPPRMVLSDADFAALMVTPSVTAIVVTDPTATSATVPVALASPISPIIGGQPVTVRVHPSLNKWSKTPIVDPKLHK